MDTSHKTDKYADDATESVGVLTRMRIPWLIVGLVGGFFVSFIVSRFEGALAQNIHLVFFLPFIVYMGDAVGTQTEIIYIRNLNKLQVSFMTYLLKEIAQGILLGLIFGTLIFTVSYFWLQSIETSITVGASMFLTMAVSPAVALIVPEILFKEHRDPALGAGPFTTILQDTIGILIYFAVASIVLFR